MGAPDVAAGVRVVDGDLEAAVVQLQGDGEGRRVADVVRVLLERGAEDGHAATVLAQALDGGIDHVPASSDVDGIDLGEQGGRVSEPELVRLGHQAAYVLGKATAAIAHSWFEVPIPDARVGAQDRREAVDVAARRGTHLREHVDHRKPCGQHRVGRDLGELGRRQVRTDDGDPAGCQWGVDVEHALVRLVVLDTDHDPLRAQ